MILAPMVRLPIVWIERVALLAVLGVAGGIDARTRRIPNGLVLVALVQWLLILGLRIDRYGLDWSFLVRRVLAGVMLAGASLLLAAMLRRKTGETPLGGGDVKLLFVMGLYLGFAEAILAVGAGCVLAVLGVAVRCFVQSRDMRSLRGTTFAFAPWLCVGTIAAVALCLLE